MVKKLPSKQETWVQSRGQEDPQEKEMATHSRVLPGKSHGQRYLAGYNPWGHKSFGHDLGTNGEGNGTPLQCSCLENPVDRGAW